MFKNMLDIIFCQTEEQANVLFDFYISKGYKVCMSTVEIVSGTHGKHTVKKLNIFK
jgi:dimeric dUTPase (all-alpha-NTP-PPase superfamily)